MLGCVPAPTRTSPLLIDVKPGERTALALAFVQFACILAAYYVIRPVRDQLSAAVGSHSLPLFYAATFVATLLLTPVFGWLVARQPRSRVVPAVYGFFIAGMLACVPLFVLQQQIGPRVLGSVFFVWVSVFNLFVVSVFWSFMADIFDPEQASRLFATIAIGGTAGAVAGPAIARVLVPLVGVPPLLAVSAALLGGAVVATFALLRWTHARGTGARTTAASAAVGGTALAGLRQVFAVPFLRNMALLMLLGDAIGTVLYALLADYVKAHAATPAARTAFYANVDLATNVLTVALQFGLTRILLMRLGAARTLVLPYVIDAIVLAVLAFVGSPLIALTLVITRASMYGILKPASDSLYTRVPREWRYKGKNVVDTAVWRFGDLAITSGFNGLRALGATVSGFAVLSAFAAAGSAWCGWRAAHAPGLAPDPARVRHDQPPAENSA